VNLSERLRQPDFGCAPIAKNRCFGNTEQRCYFWNIAAPEKPALHHQSLPGLQARQFLKSQIQSQHLCTGISIRS
jgi:hypothetical protein